MNSSGKVVKDTGSRGESKGEAGVNVVLPSPRSSHSEARIGTILNADYRSTLAIMAPLSNLLSRATASSIVG